MSDSPTGKAYIGIAVNKTTATESTNYADYTWQLTKGEKGDAGVSVTLVDVEFAKNTNATTPPAQGDAGWSTTAPTLTGTEQLWTRTKTTYSSGNPTYSTPANITPKKGDTGAVGQGIDSVTEEYAISSSKTTQPTTGWSTTQPAWVQGQYIWSRVKVVYKNPAQTIYTGYAVSSEWEAVKNLLYRHNELKNTFVDTNGELKSSNSYGSAMNGFIATSPGEQLTFSKLGVLDNSGVTGAFRYAFLKADETTIVQRSASLSNLFTITVPADGVKLRVSYPDNSNPQIERGNKQTDYIEAPEDAQARLDAEKTRINDILSDNVADPSEKQYLSNLWQEIYAEYPRIWAQANDYSVDKSNYEAKYTALNNLLSPVLANLTVNSTVSGSSIRTAFSQYYDARTVLQNAITNKVNTVASEAQAKANAAKAITDNFGTQIGGVGFDSALISTVLILLRELNSQQDTAGISGIQGAMKNNPAYWSGGTYAQAFALLSFLSAMSAETPAGTGTGQFDYSGKYPNLAKITMLHNGAAKIGDFIVEPSGRIVMVDPATGKPTLVFNVSDLPSIDDLVNNNFGGTTVSNTSRENIEVGYTLPNTISVDKDNASIEFTAGILAFSATLPTMMDRAELTVYLRRNGTNYAIVKNLTLYGPGTKSITDSISYSASGMPSGTYSIYVEIVKVGSGITTSANISASTLSWSFTPSGVRYFQFGRDGMMAFFDACHWYFSKTRGFDLRGPTNMPGAMAKGRIASNGARDTTKAWGAKNSTSSVTKPSGTGSYRVPVNCPNADYDVNISPRTANRLFYVGATTATYFDVYFQDRSGVAQDSDFSYTLVGNNY